MQHELRHERINYVEITCILHDMLSSTKHMACEEI